MKVFPLSGCNNIYSSCSLSILIFIYTILLLHFLSLFFPNLSSFFFFVFHPPASPFPFTHFSASADITWGDGVFSNINPCGPRVSQLKMCRRATTTCQYLVLVRVEYPFDLIFVPFLFIWPFIISSSPCLSSFFPTFLYFVSYIFVVYFPFPSPPPPHFYIKWSADNPYGKHRYW